MGDEGLIVKRVAGVGAGPRLLISAGVHGDEFEPMAAVRELMGTVRAEELKGRLTLVPVVNAAAFGRGERTAEDGLDLARVCPGRAEGSVTEREAFALSALVREADYYIDLHTGGNALTLVPLAGYMLHQDARILEEQRRMARAFNLPLVWGTTPNLDGRSLSVARDAGVPAIYVEHGGGGAFRAEAVRELVEGCWNVMGELGMVERERAVPAVRTVVEDAREQSGYLQINYPSPMEGVFEPAVTVGDWVERGWAIGRVSDPVSGAAAEVPANESGMVVMLRVLARVKRGDALATVIETGAGKAGLHGG